MNASLIKYKLIFKDNFDNYLDLHKMTDFNENFKQRILIY